MAKVIKTKARKPTVAEKEARGTHKPSRDIIRPLRQVQAEIFDALESLGDMQHNLREAGRAIRQEGVLVDVVARNNAGLEQRTKKLNPAGKLQKDMLSAIKSVKRAWVLLQEEEMMAQLAAAPVDDDLAGLD